MGEDGEGRNLEFGWSDLWIRSFGVGFERENWIDDQGFGVERDKALILFDIGSELMRYIEVQWDNMTVVEILNIAYLPFFLLIFYFHLLRVYIVL